MLCLQNIIKEMIYLDINISFTYSNIKKYHQYSQKDNYKTLCLCITISNKVICYIIG